jgi:hypothetical protein
VFGVTGCGSDDGEAPVESRIKNGSSPMQANADIVDRNLEGSESEPRGSIDEILEVEKHVSGNDFIVNRPPLKEGVYEVPKSGGSMSRDEKLDRMLDAKLARMRDDAKLARMRDGDRREGGFDEIQLRD